VHWHQCVTFASRTAGNRPLSGRPSEVVGLAPRLTLDSYAPFSAHCRAPRRMCARRHFTAAT
jgi:hypothetical protein